MARCSRALYGMHNSEKVYLTVLKLLLVFQPSVFYQGTFMITWTRICNHRFHVVRH